MRGPGPMIPGGGASTAAYRLGPGAARALAGAVARGLIPGVGLALGVAWLASNCYEKQGGQWVRTCFAPGQGPQASDGYEYRAGGQFTPWEGPGPACDRRAGIASDGDSANRWEFTGELFRQPEYPWVRGCVVRVIRRSDGVVVIPSTTLQIESRQSSCPIGWYQTPAGCIQSPPPQVVTPEQIEEEMAPKPLPQTLPPGVPYPLDPLAPSIWNPEPLEDTPPGVDPKSRPMRVPQGEPQAVPNTSPQQYRQPVTRWAHSPTQSDPWRMDVRPEEMTGTDPKGIEQPQSETSGSPEGKKPEQFDLCAEHPDIIACQVFKPDELEAKPLANKDVPLSLNPDGGFPSGGSCPQPKTVQLLGQTYAFSMQPLCDFAVGIKPLLIGFAWLSAALVFLGVARRES